MANVIRDFGAADLSGIDWVARAKDLAPVIASAAPEIDAGRGFTPELVAALHASGLYRLLLPRSCGGAEVDAMTFAEVIAEIAAHDASTAWCIGLVTACSMSAAYMELDAAKSSDRPTPCSPGARPGRGRRTGPSSWMAAIASREAGNSRAVAGRQRGWEPPLRSSTVMCRD